MHSTLLVFPTSSSLLQALQKWQLGFWFVCIFCPEFAPTVIFSTVQFLCIFLLEERCVQVQALQQRVPGSSLSHYCWTPTSLPTSASWEMGWRGVAATVPAQSVWRTLDVNQTFFKGTVTRGDWIRTTEKRWSPSPCSFPGRRGWCQGMDGAGLSWEPIDGDAHLGFTTRRCCELDSKSLNLTILRFTILKSERLG